MEMVILVARRSKQLKDRNSSSRSIMSNRSPNIPKSSFWGKQKANVEWKEQYDAYKAAVTAAEAAANTSTATSTAVVANKFTVTLEAATAKVDTSTGTSAEANVETSSASTTSASALATFLTAAASAEDKNLFLPEEFNDLKFLAYYEKMNPPPKYDIPKRHLGLPPGLVPLPVDFDDIYPTSNGAFVRKVTDGAGDSIKALDVAEFNQWLDQYERLADHYKLYGSDKKMTNELTVADMEWVHSQRAIFKAGFLSRQLMYIRSK